MTETITLAGGCFWCTEAIFQRLKGVISTTSGYANGKTGNPTYEDVSFGNSGFAEAIRIKFNPHVISLKHLLDIFWATHDLTSLNRQGADIGAQYRSAIFYENDKQKKDALESAANLEKSGELKGKAVTEIVPLKNFYTAEEYHQNFYEENKDKNSYCMLVINPKIEKLVKEFNSDLEEKYR